MGVVAPQNHLLESAAPENKKRTRMTENFASDTKATHRSLRTRLIVALSVLVFMAIVLIGTGVTLFVYRTVRADWLKRQEQAAALTAHTIDNLISQVQSNMALAGDLAPNYLAENPQALQSLVEQNPALLEVARLDARGNILGSACKSNNSILNDSLTIPQSTWFQQAQQGNRYASNLQIAVDDEPFIILALPASDGGVIASRLSMNVLWDIVSSLYPDKSGQAYIVNRDGDIIAHPDTSLVVDDANNIEDRPEFGAAFASPDQCRSDEYTNFTGQVVFGSTCSLHQNNWLVFAEISRQEAYAATRSALFFMVGTTFLLGIVLILATTLALDRMILRPIATLSDGSVRIGSGDLNYRIYSKRKDELGQVSNAFDQMAANLKQREDALSQARDAALAASQFKSRLLANVSHDLRTPLNGILGYADILKEEIYGPLNDRQTNAVQRILANTSRLLDLVNSLLDQSLIEAGKIELNFAEFSPRDLIRDTESIMAVLTQQKGLQLTVQITADFPEFVTADQQRCQQVLSNLIGNAIKFTDTGSIHIRAFRDSNYWAFEVHDTGRGIPTDALQYIFEPFRQVDSSPTRDQGGVGLGLSIVQQMVVLMGGTVQVASQPGRGSTFTVRLPISPKEA